jgi:imidazolonepropionase-like amidohydrolase
MINHALSRKNKMVQLRFSAFLIGISLSLLLSPSRLTAQSAIPDSEQAPKLACVGGTVFLSPTEPPIENAVVIIRDGKIASVTQSGIRSLPKTVRQLDCTGMFITAGFQNSHVHFTEPKWVDAAHAPAARLAQQMEEMLTRYGFTTVFEAVSLIDNTVALRRRVENGEVPGPRILTAGNALYPDHGIPFYLLEVLPPAILAQLLTPNTPAEAVRDVQHNLDAGADALKLFTVTWATRDTAKAMSLEIATAAVAAAHERGKLAFAHPSNTEGMEIALASHVDVLAHAVENMQGWKPEFIAKMVSANMAMIPTLTLFDQDRAFPSIVDQVRNFSQAGGQILFGTDVGFLSYYDPTVEYRHMAEAGLTPMQILASLTTAPAKRFGEASKRGRIVVGQLGDLVILRADPRADVAAFGNVYATIRGGRILYQSAGPQQTR